MWSVVLHVESNSKNWAGMFYIAFFIGVSLLYNVVLVSVVQRSESAVCMPISPPS